MKPGVLLLMLIALDAQALEPANLMNKMLWEKRVILVFAPDSEDPDLQLQDTVLASDRAGLVERELVVIRVLADGYLSIDGVRHDDAAMNFYRHFGTDPNSFRAVLIGKDGGVKLDRDSTVSAGELFALVDSMPMRRREMLEDG